MFAIGKFVFNDHKRLLNLDRDLYHRRQNNDDRSVLLTRLNLPSQSLNDLCGLGKPMKVLQHQDRRSFGRCQSVERANRGQRITAVRSCVVIARNAQPCLDVPGRQPPALFTTDRGDLGQPIVRFERLDPQGGETGPGILVDSILKIQNEVPFQKWIFD